MRIYSDGRDAIRVMVAQLRQYVACVGDGDAAQRGICHLELAVIVPDTREIRRRPAVLFDTALPRLEAALRDKACRC